ncbi:MAG: hypothetical protein LBU81_07995 [Methanosarcinales archaeon]|nr:hypothetical protein [Methanosarcinales archaeon]
MTVSVCGCIADIKKSDFNEIGIDESEKENSDEPYINVSMSCSQYSGNVSCGIDYWIYDNYEIDESNITAVIDGNKIMVTLPAKQKEGAELSSYRLHDSISLKIGERDSFEEDKIYSVILENNTEIGTFSFENGELYSFTPCFVQGIKIKTDGNKIIAAAQTGIGVEPIFSIDEKNATVSGTFENNVYTIKLSEKKPDYKGAYPLPLIISSHEFEIADADELKNGKYDVRINDMEASFIIRSGNVVRIYNSGEYWTVD